MVYHADEDCDDVVWNSWASSTGVPHTEHVVIRRDTAPGWRHSFSFGRHDTLGA